jgi:PAS domain S-box-containing protein
VRRLPHGQQTAQEFTLFPEGVEVTADQPGVATGELRDDSYRLLVSAVVDYAILMLDPQGRVVSWNAGAERIKGWTADEIIGKHVSVFYPEADARSGKIEHELAQARRAGRYEDESWRVRKDGSLFWANVVITALFGADGVLLGYGKVTRDMTERRQFEQDLESARHAAEAANKAKDEFLSSMSHELRTPLNAILGFSQLLERDRLEPGQLDAVRHIRKAGDHLLAMINEILDLSRIASGQLSLSPEAVSVAEILDEAASMVDPLASARGITISIDGRQVPDAHVVADRQRIKQVLLNLLANAIKYNHVDGAVTVTARPGEPGRLLIEVIDTGPGISDSMMERLFRPFDRLGAAAEVEGAGLGLALSAGLVQAMDGSLTASSAIGQGSTFRIDLPLAEHPDPDVVAHPTREVTPPKNADPGVVRAHIVYIEDNLSNVHLVQRILQLRPGVELLPAMLGGLGLELAVKHRPALVLLDLHLPDIAGADVLHRLKGERETADIPVVVMSADATRSSIGRLMDAGASDYITKPIDVEVLLAVVDRWCGATAG